jgi:protein-tyrosine phosphatase
MLWFMPTHRQTPSVLFVCLGNICRSPLAEVALRREAARRGLDLFVDSAGTADYHVGEPPDPRTCDVARSNGCDAAILRGRQLSPDDFRRFDLIYALDRDNLTDIKARAPTDATARIALLLEDTGVDGIGGSGEVADPYYGDISDFRMVWDQVSAAATVIVDRLSAD